MAQKIKYDEQRMKDLSKGIRKTSYYKKENLSSPDKGINPDHKDSREYMKPWAEKLYSLFLKKRTWMGDGYDDIDIMRSYMEGNQPVDQYRDFLYGANGGSDSVAINAEGYDVRDTASSKVSDRMA